MSGKVTVHSTSLDRKLAAMAILTQKGLLESVKDGAKRFVRTAIRNTAPMMLNKSPSQAKREWETKLTRRYETRRLTPKGYRKYSEVKRILTAKKKKLGRSAAGWCAAALRLKVASPAWVKRHGTSEGRYSESVRDGKIRVIVTNSVPYNQSQTFRRATYALRRVEKGISGNLRNLKRRVIRQVR